MKYFFITFLFISSILSEQIITDHLSTDTTLDYKTAKNTGCVGSSNYNGSTQDNTFLQGTLSR